MKITIEISPGELLDRIAILHVKQHRITDAVKLKNIEAEVTMHLGAMAPLGRPGTAEEVAEAIIWLLADESSYVTGTILDVTGGR